MASSDQWAVMGLPTLKPSAALIEASYDVCAADGDNASKVHSRGDGETIGSGIGAARRAIAAICGYRDAHVAVIEHFIPRALLDVLSNGVRTSPHLASPTGVVTLARLHR